MITHPVLPLQLPQMIQALHFYRLAIEVRRCEVEQRHSIIHHSPETKTLLAPPVAVSQREDSPAPVCVLDTRLIGAHRRNVTMISKSHLVILKIIICCNS
jgi:hypothetical protein